MLGMTDNELVKMQQKQELDVNETKLAFSTMMDARSSRKKAKEVLRKMTVDTKLRDMRILAQNAVTKLSNEVLFLV
jgi:hypothetical protein